MNIAYVLIFGWFMYGGQLRSQEFGSLDSCKAAATEFLKTAQEGFMRPFAFCVRRE